MNKTVILLLLCAMTAPFGLGENSSLGSGFLNVIIADAGPDVVPQDVLSIQERQIRNAVLFTLVPVVVAFSFIVFIFYRAKRESFFRQKKAELEVKALRAQINPHFIFNCLNSIHHYMHKHGAQLSGEYLIKFSRLMRYVLETSSSRLVPLSDDLEALKMYIELEQLRLQGCFDYEIVTPFADPSSVYIPPMMMQPFVENSIWHGLSKKGSGGMIRVVIETKADMIQCLIEDNGQQSSTRENEHSAIKKTSMGMSLIKDRLAVVSQIYHVKANFTIENRLNDKIPGEGTRILLLLPFEQ